MKSEVVAAATRRTLSPLCDVVSKIIQKAVCHASAMLYRECNSSMAASSPLDISKLAAMIKAKRGSQPLRETAEEITGLTASTLSRIERGNVPDLETFMRLCKWLGVSADQFGSKDKESSSASMSMPDVIEANLRADRVLPVDAIQALSQMVRFAYKAASEGRLKDRE